LKNLKSITFNEYMNKFIINILIIFYINYKIINLINKRWLQNNQLTGSIPESIGKLTNLEDL